MEWSPTLTHIAEREPHCAICPALDLILITTVLVIPHRDLGPMPRCRWSAVGLPSYHHNAGIVATKHPSSRSVVGLLPHGYTRSHPPTGPPPRLSLSVSIPSPAKSRQCCSAVATTTVTNDRSDDYRPMNCNLMQIDHEALFALRQFEICEQLPEHDPRTSCVASATSFTIIALNKVSSKSGGIPLCT